MTDRDAQQAEGEVRERPAVSTKKEIAENAADHTTWVRATHHDAVAADAYPDALNKQQVAVAAGYEANGGAFNNALGRLRSLELIKGRGEIRASDDLF